MAVPRPDNLELIPDAGAGKTLITEKHAKYMLNVKKLPPGERYEIHTASGHMLQATHSCNLPFSSLSPEASQALIVPGLTDSLVSVASLCDAGHTVTYEADKFTCVDSTGTVIITGRRATGYAAHRLWILDLDPDALQDAPVQAFASFQYKISLMSHAELVRYVYETMGNPTPQHFLEMTTVINFPGLTKEMVRKNMPHTVASARGNIRGAPSGYHSTKAPAAPAPATASADTDTDESEPQSPDQPAQNKSEITVSVLRGRWAYDQTGALFVESADGDLYILVAHHEDADYIHVEILKSKSELLLGVKACHEFFKSRGLDGTYVTLDNEWSHHTIVWFNAAKIKYQLAPVGQHRTNRAERAIQTFKRHFLSIMCGADPGFPLNLWHTCVHQAEITLNLMRLCPWDHSMSAWEGLHGRPWNWDAHPMGPIGSKVVMHEYPASRGSWQPSGTVAYYVGPAPHHYRCWTVVNPATSKTRVASCLEWMRPALKMPGSSPE